MKRYYQHDAESEVGFGVVYIEFDGEWATRQVEIYGDHWFCSTKEYHPEIGLGLSDQLNTYDIWSYSLAITEIEDEEIHVFQTRSRKHHENC